MNDELAAFAHELADLSDDAILPHFRNCREVEEKAGKNIYDPVTVADRAGEQAIRAAIESRYPHHGVIGEEFGSVREDAEYCWVLDPIDGTRAFILGAPTWGTLIGLYRNGAPYLGLMSQPFTRERFWTEGALSWARHDAEAPRQLKASANEDLSRASLATTAPEHFAEKADWVAFQRLSEGCRMTRYGYDCYAYCLLAMGHLDLVAEAGLASYDIAALIPIVERAGGVITCWNGGSAAQGGTVLAAGNAALHAQAMALLKG